MKCVPSAPSFYIPPINSISSMATFQQNPPMNHMSTNKIINPVNSLNTLIPVSIPHSAHNMKNQNGPFNQDSEHRSQDQQDQETSSKADSSSHSDKNTFPPSRDLIPSVVGPDGVVYQKPPGSYASIITKALKESKTGKMTLAGIYDWIKSNYPYYRSAEASWQVKIHFKNYYCANFFI